MRGAGRRSPLYLWLRENHDALVATFAQSGPSWVTVARYLGEHGILDGDAKPPTARGARNAWGRVRKDVAKARAATSSPLTVHVPTDTEEAPKPRFGTARLRGHTPAPPPAETKATRPPAAAQDPDEVIARLIGSPTRSKFKPNE